MLSGETSSCRLGRLVEPHVYITRSATVFATIMFSLLATVGTVWYRFLSVRLTVSNVLTRLVHGDCYSVNNVPTISHPVVRCGTGNPIVSAPLTYGFRDSIYGYPNVFRCVISLLNTASPATVTRLVVAVIINPIKFVFGSRFVAHIIEKVRELIPSFTDTNATTTIPMISPIVFVPTTFSHSSPRVIFGGVGSSYTHTNIIQDVH
jgi:hypothetical protein